MPIAISDDHRILAETVGDFLEKHKVRAANRALLEAGAEVLPTFWPELASVGWLGLHLDEADGGSGFGLSELCVVVEGFGRAIAPGPFVPTVIASALVSMAGSPELRRQVLAGLADGSSVAGIGLGGTLELSDDRATGDAGVVLGAGLADLFVVPAGDDVVVVERRTTGVSVELPRNLDPSRRCGRVRLAGAPVRRILGARRLLIDLARLILSAEAVGVARECTEQAAEYAKVRQQFGRPIATFQAVKHHCANMAVAVELATSLVWDAARAAQHGGDQLTYTAAMAAALAVPVAEQNAQLSIQVHGGIGFTWEHDAHLYLRRAAAIEAVVDAESAAEEVTTLVRRGVRRARAVDLPPEAEPIRASVQDFVSRVADLDEDARRKAMIEEGYAMPHWPKPWGREAGAIEQLVIEQEFARAGVVRPNYGITGWVILTIIQHATDDQVSRWVFPALNQELIWCQLFSEPNAGSDAAGIQTRGSRVDGGWIVNGQKVWTSGAHRARYGLATVRTNPEVPKHEGITMMVIDMHGDGVEVRPLRQATGNADFNEVFFTDVFVPDDDVVGPVDGGWTVARATLGNESVSIGGGSRGESPHEHLVAAFDAHPDRLPGGAARVGRYVARSQATDVFNVRSIHRAVSGSGPGPEGAMAKLVVSENGQELAAMMAALAGPDLAFLDGDGAIAGLLVLSNRAGSIAGGTSEIKRNQIGERILGLPRDPLVR